MENTEIKVIRLEIEANTISSLRNTYINILSILIGGVCGLFFLQNSNIKSFLIIAGLITIWLFIVLIVRCIKEIQYILQKIKDMEQ